MPSRLAKLRNDTKVVWGCLAISLLILGTLATQKITAATADQQGKQQQSHLAQQQAAAQIAGLADAQKRASIEANAQGWRAWQAHIGHRCTAQITKLEDRSYVGFTLNKKRLVYEGLLICDRDRIGILKGPELKPMWMVPRIGSKHPMPTTPPPPEFQPVQINQNYHDQEKLLRQREVSA